MHSPKGIKIIGVKKKIRVIIVGCGRVSKYHLAAIHTQKPFHLVGVCDIDPLVAKDTAEGEGVPVISFGDLRKSIVDIVVISTPSGLHFEHALHILKLGIHVLIEKPVTLSTENLRILIREGKKNKAELFVVQQQRFLPSLQFLHSKLSELGEVFAIQMHLFWARSQRYYEQADWRGTKTMDGGLMFNQGVHSIDLLTWLFGEIHQIHGYKKTRQRKIETEDTAVITMEFTSGALGSLTSTVLSPGENFEAGFTLIAEKGIVRLGGMSFERIEYWKVKGVEAPLSLQRATDYVYEKGHQKIYEEIAKYLNGNRAAKIISGESAFNAIATIEAFYKSCETEKQVEVKSF